MPRRLSDMVRGLLAASILVLVVAGLPVLLVQEVGWPLPTELPTWEQFAQALTTGAIEDATIVKTLAVLVWLAWGNFTLGLVLEVAALARRRPPRRVTGLRSGQRLAGNLLTTASLAITTLSRTGVMPVTDPAELGVAIAANLNQQDSQVVTVATQETVTVRLSGGGPEAGAGDRTPTPPSPSSGGALRTYEVQRGDTLWDLAEHFLGDGLRWREIRDLNVGRVQPDGGVMRSDGEDVVPGWLLDLPPVTGTGVPVEDDTPAASVSLEIVTVEQGDTLWGIAEEHLDDPFRWPEIYEDNRGEPQPDGRTLTDPDLIHPGWVLELSDDSGTDVTLSEAGLAEPLALAERDVVAGPDAAGAPNDVAAAADVAEPEVVEEEGIEPSVGREAVTVEASPREEPPPTGEGESDEDGHPIATTAASAALVAGAILTLDRLRRARLRRREPGHRIPLPTGDDQERERTLRLQSDADVARFLDLSLRELACAYEPGRPLPPVTLVSYGPDDVAVHFEAPTEVELDGWVPADASRTWSRPRPADLDTLALHRGTPSRLPALVTLGTLPGDRVGMLNLAHARCLHLEGEQELAVGLMQAWALELATTPRADVLDVVTVGVDGLPNDLERLDIVSDAAALQARLGRPQTTDANLGPTTVVLAHGLSHAAATLLRTATEIRTDVVAVATGLNARTGSSVIHVQGSEGRLEPGGIGFQLLDLAPDAVPTTARLLQQALHDPDQLVPIPELPDVSVPTDLPEHQLVEPTTILLDEEKPVAKDEPAVEVRILGPVEIIGAEKLRTNKAMELIVYLAMHRSGTDADTLMEALWPDQEPRTARLYTEASRARKALGTAPDGTLYLPEAELGRYRLTEAVALDYERFTASVAAARREPARAEDHLRTALSRVRGVPLSATATEHAWATNDVYRLSQEIVDTAHQLAQLYLQHGRHQDAVWAAEQGLSADPMAEVLVRDLMEAAAVTGNMARVQSAMGRLRCQATEDGDTNDADDWMHPHTLETYERLVASTPRTEASV